MSISVSLARLVPLAGLMKRVQPIEQVKKENSTPVGSSDQLQKEPTP